MLILMNEDKPTTENQQSAATEARVYPMEEEGLIMPGPLSEDLYGSKEEEARPTLSDD